MNVKPRIYTEFVGFKTTKEVKELFLKASALDKEYFTHNLKKFCLAVIKHHDEVKPHELVSTQKKQKQNQNSIPNSIPNSIHSFSTPSYQYMGTFFEEVKPHESNEEVKPHESNEEVKPHESNDEVKPHDNVLSAELLELIAEVNKEEE